MNCWEIMKCSEEARNNCPAYPDKGLDCWKITGTQCSGGKYKKASLLEKIIHCRQCEFYEKYASKV